ncbi:hypothetical protein C8J56DRAFT_935200 [Mycena floridula]|nr:hypothetical protein C8J56DRAFT_935200 [Mycena floridula]
MAPSTLFRRTCFRGPCSRRYASTSVKSTYQQPEKMRALISLYHQSSTCITAEKLSDAIDAAFAGPKDMGKVVTLATVDRNYLKKSRRQQQEQPKISEWQADDVKPDSDRNWSAKISGREGRVIEALYGVDASNGKDPVTGTGSFGRSYR